MTTEQDLVVDQDEAQKQNEQKNTDNFFSGGGGVENAVSSYKAIVNGDWDTAGLSVMSLGIDAVGFLTNPLQTLASWGVGWLIEHVPFLSDAFNALMGDPNEIAGMASTWQNVGKQVEDVAEQYRNAARSTTDWEGKAADAYRKMASGLSDHIDALAASGKGMKGAVEGAGTVVSAVRGIVRDLIAGAVGEIISIVLKWGAAIFCTAGIAAGGAIADIVTSALKWADKISGYMKKLAEVLTNLSKHLDKLGSAATAVRKKIDEFFNLLSNPPQGGLVNVQAQQSLTEQTLKESADSATKGSNRLVDSLAGIKAGARDFKPWQQGDLFQPHFQVAPDGGATKLGTDTVKEYAKLDDGDDDAQQNKESS